MTKLTPEAVAWRELLEKEKPKWPPELVKAATFVRCELDMMRLKNWEASGGPKKLKEYTDEFERLYAEHKAKSTVRDVQ